MDWSLFSDFVRRDQRELVEPLSPSTGTLSCALASALVGGKEEELDVVAAGFSASLGVLIEDVAWTPSRNGNRRLRNQNHKYRITYNTKYHSEGLGLSLFGR